ncbi:MAG: efflux transporter outer membrane subunit [Planctomycetota bacterium]
MLNSFIKAATAVVLACLTSGCLVGPDYSRPEVMVPSQWNSPVKDGLEAAQQKEAAWWKTFADPVLTSLVERAEEQNHDVRAAVKRIHEAMAQYGVTFGELFPDLDAVASYRRFGTSENATNSQVTGFQFDDRDLYTFGAELQWELDLWGRVRRAVEASSADLQSTVEDLRDVLVVLQAEVAGTYVDLRSLQRRVEIVKANVELQKQTVATVSTRFDAGLVEELDVTQAEGTLAQTEAEAERVKRLLVVAKNRLCVLVGVQPGELESILSERRAIPMPAATITIGIPSDLLRQRPDIRRAERDLASATARIGVREADLYPRLTLFGSFTFESDDASTWIDPESQAFTVGPNIRWNLLHGGRVRELICVEDARAEEAHVRYEQTVLRAMEDVENALASHHFQSRRLGFLQTAEAQALRSIELVAQLYDNGVADYLRVLESQRALLLAQDAKAQTQADLARNTIGLYRAMGGGWISNEVDVRESDEARNLAAEVGVDHGVEGDTVEAREASLRRAGESTEKGATESGDQDG